MPQRYKSVKNNVAIFPKTAVLESVKLAQLQTGLFSPDHHVGSRMHTVSIACAYPLVCYVLWRYWK